MPPLARPGDPHRLGASCDPHGTNFAVFSSVGGYGGRVSLALVDDAGTETAVPLFAETDIWHGYVPGVGPGQRYGCRVTGPVDPGRGLFFDPGVLLLDPYAKAMAPAGSGGPRALISLLVDTAFEWGADAVPRRPVADAVLYEVHVKGISIAHPDVPAEFRGTYAGLAHPAVLDHLVGLGVTTLELMPVKQFLSEQFLLDRHLANYWGYSTIGFFAPHGAYCSAGSSGQQVPEFKAMVAAVHAAGLEVILDVVYNHTAEGSDDAPALSFRGLDNDAYYRVDPANPSRYLGHHREREQPQHRPIGAASAYARLAPVLGDRHARRRVPVRPGRSPRP